MHLGVRDDKAEVVNETFIYILYLEADNFLYNWFPKNVQEITIIHLQTKTHIKSVDFG